MGRSIIELLVDRIHKTSQQIGAQVNLMEVCGTHTVAIFRHGIRGLLPDNVRLLSGPGCPVCVTAIEDIERAMEIASHQDVIFTTFGDMMRVPGNRGNLNDRKAAGADIRVVYSPLDALSIAREEKEKKVVFFATGFETTSPSVAATIYSAEADKVENFYIYSVHKLVPPALEVLLHTPEVNIDGFILPGHVSAIIGTKPYLPIAEKYRKAGVVTGFDASDILEGISLLLTMILNKAASIEIQYKKVVKEEGNPKAVAMIDKFFVRDDALWRGIGVLPKSGLSLSEQYRHRDVLPLFDISLDVYHDNSACSCGDVLKGIKLPLECRLFGTGCTPDHPVGPCMVSIEGSCSAYYKYGAC